MSFGDMLLPKHETIRLPRSNQSRSRPFLSVVHCEGQQPDNWADAIVRDLWRPVTLGLCIGIPVIYGFYTFILGKRFPTASHIPPEAFAKRQTIRGKVVSVGDSDNFRLYHTPGWGWGLLRRIPTSRKDLKDQTISVRVAGVDAPEGAHFGMPSQPYSDEAKAYLTSLVLNRHVKIQLLSRDQYSRAVSMAYVRRPPFFFQKNVSVEMLKKGLATIYTAKGAQYAEQLPILKRAETRAKLLRKGIWSLKKYVSPEEHKAKYLRGNETK